jgi:hypothetical protein
MKIVSFQVQPPITFNMRFLIKGYQENL